MDRYILKMVRERQESVRREIARDRLAGRVATRMLSRLRMAIGRTIIKIGIAIKGDFTNGYAVASMRDETG